MFDLALTIPALLFFAPLLVAVAIAIKLDSPGPVTFRQKRVGFGNRLFDVYKFRSMVVDESDDLGTRSTGHADDRVTRVGRFIRRTSLDELPQLFNVLAGTMSIVGPRPIVQAEAVRYRRYFHTYCQVRPGITGLWQISGRNTTTYRRRVACDVAYIRRKSTAGDLRIMLRTVPAVFLGYGAY